VTEQLAKYNNGIGINSLTWSEYYVSTVACANHDGSNFRSLTLHYFKGLNLWNVNNGKKLVSVQAEKGGPLKAVDWNHLEPDLILTGSFSSRVKLFDVNSN
jgi:WD40 repeat protein